jgi:histidine triad (HIT) family protein
MNKCVFCGIVDGDVQATILELDNVAAVFLDRNQAARGHVLIVPRTHVAHWHELDADTAAHIGRLAQKWAEALNNAFLPDGYNISVNNGEAAGQDVFHVHMHIFPRAHGDGYYKFGGRIEVASDDEKTEIANRLIAGLRK